MITKMNKNITVVIYSKLWERIQCNNFFDSSIIKNKKKIKKHDKEKYFKK
jgi:hypothetical protein